MATNKQIAVSEDLLKLVNEVDNVVHSGLPRSQVMRATYSQIHAVLNRYKLHSTELYNSLISLISRLDGVPLEDILIRVICFDK